MHSEFGSRVRTVYRLIIATRHDELVCDAPVFRHYKRAVSHIPAAVRRHARDGHPQGVILQCGQSQSSSDGVTWTALERWDSAVIERILRQQGHVARDNAGDSQRRFDVPCGARLQAGVGPRVPHRGGSHTALAERPTPASEPLSKPTVRLHATHAARPKSHRWRWGLVVVAVAWITITAMFNNGGWPSWVPAGGPDKPALATELPFDAHADASSASPERSRASSPAQ